MSNDPLLDPSRPSSSPRPSILIIHCSIKFLPFCLSSVPALSTFLLSFFFPPCSVPSQSSIKTFLLLSEAIIFYPGLPMYNLSFPLLLYLSLHLSIRGMSFNMPPVTSHSQEAHPTSHSPCPLFLNEGHMRCGQHWS